MTAKRRASEDVFTQWFTLAVEEHLKHALHSVPTDALVTAIASAVWKHRKQLALQQSAADAGDLIGNVAGRYLQERGFRVQLDEPPAEPASEPATQRGFKKIQS